MPWTKDKANRVRWSRQQRKAASDTFAASLPTVAEERAAKLADLRELAASLEGKPHMATMLAHVRAEITRLEA